MGFGPKLLYLTKAIIEGIKNKDQNTRGRFMNTNISYLDVSSIVPDFESLVFHSNITPTCPECGTFQGPNRWFIVISYNDKLFLVASSEKKKCCNESPDATIYYRNESHASMAEKFIFNAISNNESISGFSFPEIKNVELIASIMKSIEHSDVPEVGAVGFDEAPSWSDKLQWN
jgi:hypothetical protein